jgi:1-acyl-sn-glycerol-3-phosphate acyltransferase
VDGSVERSGALRGGRGLGAAAAEGASPLTIARAKRPSPAALAAACVALARVAARRAHPHDLDARDEEFIEALLPLMDVLYDEYFRCETELDADIPDGPVLLVANHNGMTGTPDMFCHMTAFWRRYTPKRLGYGLMHDMPFSVPAAGAWLNAAGAVAANPENARAALERGAALLVFPGGDVDACKPFRDRYKIDFAGRRGFVRLAIREGVPVVPVVSAGGHESLFILNDGRRLARWLGLDKRFRSNVAPIGVALPFGLVFGVPYPHVPPPVKIHSRILAPIHLGLPAHAADDPIAVEHAYRAIVEPMRAAMEGLRAAGRHGLFPRAASPPGDRA